MNANSALHYVNPEILSSNKDHFIFQSMENENMAFSRSIAFGLLLFSAIGLCATAESPVTDAVFDADGTFKNCENGLHRSSRRQTYALSYFPNFS